MNNSQLFNLFVKEYVEWCETGKRPTACDQDSAFLLETQKERLNKHAVHMRCRIKQYDQEPNEFYSIGTKINAFREHGHVERELEFLRDDKLLFHVKNDQGFIQMVINDENPENLYDRFYECPNCGAGSSVKSLLAGCPYCETRFLMKDLFPIVNNFWFVRQDSSQTIIKIDRKIIRRTRLILYPFIFVFFLLNGAKILPAALVAVLGAFLVGGILGRFFSMFAIYFSTRGGNGEAKISSDAINTDKKVIAFLSEFDPDFQYYYFEGQIISLLKMCMLSEHPENLCCFEAGKREGTFKDILDSIYSGAMLLRGTEVRDGICRLDMRAYFVDIIDNSGEIISRGDKVDFSIERSLKAVSDQNFSIHAVNCKSCGGSFDAAHRKLCPYCAAEYNLKEKNWVVVKMAMA